MERNYQDLAEAVTLISLSIGEQKEQSSYNRHTVLVKEHGIIRELLFRRVDRLISLSLNYGGSKDFTVIRNADTVLLMVEKYQEIYHVKQLLYSNLSDLLDLESKTIEIIEKILLNLNSFDQSHRNAKWSFFQTEWMRHWITHHQFVTELKSFMMKRFY